MTTVTMDLPETVFSALHSNPKDFVREMRVASAIKWYEMGRISQGTGAAITGLNRAEFISAICDV